MLFQNNFKRREELFKAVENADIKTVRNLIRNGIDIRATNKKGMNIIMTSMKLKKKSEFQRELFREIRVIDRGFYTLPVLFEMVMLKDIDGRTALHHAVIEKNLAAITMLASKGIELDEKDENGDTALHLAVDEPENLYIVKTLLELGAARHLKNDSSLTPLNIAEINSQTDKSEESRKKFAVIAKAFRTKKFAKVANAQTAMTKSTEMGDLGAFKNALYAGGNITMVNYKNENIIHKAAWFGRLNILTSILEGPQNAQHIKGLVNSRDSAGCTPLHNAVIRNHYDMVDALMENGADPNIQDNMGMTPIMEAAFWDKVDLLELLLTRRPNLSHKDKHGRDIYEIARRRRARRCFVALRTRN